MTAVLDRPPSPHAAPRPPSRLARWAGSWRVALRLAARDARRGLGRSILVVLLVALPVAVVTLVLVQASASSWLHSTAGQGLLSLGSRADARLQWMGVASTVQAPDGSAGFVTSPENAVAAPSGAPQDPSTAPPAAAPTPPSLAQVAARLPQGSHVERLAGSSVTGAVVEGPVWGLVNQVTLADVRQPLLAGTWHVHEGHLPDSPGQIALDPDVANRLQVGLGSTVTVTVTDGAPGAARLTVVGLASAAQPFAGGVAGVALPQSLPGRGDGDTATWDPATDMLLISSPTPMTWADVRRLNALGIAATSRDVIESPPSFCALDQACLDSGPAPVAPPETGTMSAEAGDEAARTAAIIGVGAVLAALQIALLAGPAFAVQLRRRQRELGLVGASGGAGVDLRRTVLSSGLVLGSVGAVLGVVVGWLVVWLLGGALPWAPFAEQGVSLGVPSVPASVIPLALVGVAAALGAALVPAVIAGRGDVVDALRGRRPLPALQVRTPLLGLALVAVGTGLLLYGRPRLDVVVLGLGILVAELGVILVMPWLVVHAAALGRWLPLPGRLALRDAGRHRIRTAAAACAVAAGAALAVASASWSSQFTPVDAYVDVAPVGAFEALVSATTGDGGATATAAEAALAHSRELVGQLAPGSRPITLTGVVPRAAVSASGTESDTYGVIAVCQHPPTPTDGSAGQGSADVSGVSAVAPVNGFGCGVRNALGSGLSGDVAVLDDPARLGEVLGDVDPELLARGVEALDAGHAVVLQPGVLDAKGQVVLQSSRTADDGSVVPTGSVSIPAVEVTQGALPDTVIVGPRALAADGALTPELRLDPWSALLEVAHPPADVPDRPTFDEQANLAFAKARTNASGWTVAPVDARDNVGETLALIAAGTLLLALLAGLMVTALATADARPDLTTLAAVGAEPRLRRWFAASSAAVVTVLGGAVGAVSGLGLAMILRPIFAPLATATTVPWTLVAFVVLGVPLITGAVAFATTRSRLVLVRRRET